MMYLYSYLETAALIIRDYKGTVPFAQWIKQFFKERKKYGSKDRKYISELCYNYFRLGHSLNEIDIKEKLLIGYFLSGKDPGALQSLKPGWEVAFNKTLEEKIEFLQLENTPFFPFPGELSPSIEVQLFNVSLLVQPLLFLRTRPGKQPKVIEALNKGEVAFEIVNDNCISLKNATRIEDLVQLDSDVIIQDLNSQMVFNSLKDNLQPKQNLKVWDCCAASGGKSILFHDLYPQSQISVSDIRESILYNLQNRLRRARVNIYRSFVADITADSFHTQDKFHVIICDAPCSGSGTWSRTPEQQVFFTTDKIIHYAALQKKIAVNAAKHLLPKGYFVYITCSVFIKENEEVVDHIIQHTSLILVSSSYLKGYTCKADTLFVALFQL